MPDFGIPSKWMRLPEEAGSASENATLSLFRRSFELDADALSRFGQGCVLRVSADSRYRFYVNGAFVEAGPCKGDDKVRYYDAVDIGSHLRQGANVIAVEVLRYPFGQGAANHSVFSSEYPGLYVEEIRDGLPEPIDQTWESLRVDAADPTSGGRLGLTASGDWHCRQDEGFAIVPEGVGFVPLHIHESRTGSAGLLGWTLPDFKEDEAWQPARLYNAFEINRASVPGNLLPRPIPFMRRTNRHFQGVKTLRRSEHGAARWNQFLAGSAPLTLAPHSETVLDIDAGEEMCGFPSLRLSGGGGAEIEILYSEAYAASEKRSPDGQRIPVKADRSDASGALYGYRDRYSACGCGTQALPEAFRPFWFRTFRFIRLTVRTADAPLTLVGFDYMETGYPLEPVSYVETSDPSYAPIWDISLRTLRRCMHETYMDCPFYEQLQYAMDSRNEILYTYAIAMDDRLARQCMDDFRRSQRYDGLLNSCYPNRKPNVIPGFSIFYILMLWDHLRYFGDEAFLREHLSCIDGILTAYDRRLTSQGLVGNMGGVLMDARYWSFIDWTPQWDATVGVPDAVKQGPVTLESFLWVAGLMAAADILRFVKREDTAREYERRAAALRDALRTHCRRADGLFTDGPGFPAASQHCQVFAVLTDTVTPEEGRGLLLPTLTEPEKHAQCSVSMMYYLFRALEKTDLYNCADQKWDIWRGMVGMNLTTCVEDGVTGRSDCHAWGALALYEWPSVTLGVRPAAPGYGVLRIHPVPGRLEQASGDVLTPHGIVHVEWKKKADGSLDLRYQAPEGVPVILD